MLTDEQCKQNDHIPKSVILTDIDDTQKEIDDYEKQLYILFENPLQNKVRIYFIEGHKSKAETLVSQLKCILKYREKIKNQKK